MAENTQVDVKKLSFERAIEELELIVKRLEDGKVPLEESVAIYERGEALKRRCEELLRQAEARVDKITTDASGQVDRDGAARRAVRRPPGCFAVRVVRLRQSLRGIPHSRVRPGRNSSLRPLWPAIVRAAIRGTESCARSAPPYHLHPGIRSARACAILPHVPHRTAQVRPALRLSATIGRPQGAPDGEIASWTIETKADDWQTRTDYDFLRFEDFIQRDLAAPIWRTVFQAVWIYWRLVFPGTIARFCAANWRFATFITYPHFLLLLEAVGAAGIAFGFGKGLRCARRSRSCSALPRRSRCSSPLLGTVLKYTENQTYLLYLLSDTIWTWQFSHRQRPEWDQRIDRFAQYLVKVVRDSDAEEIVHRRPQLGVVPGHRDPGARAASSIPRSAGTARASCC